MLPWQQLDPPCFARAPAATSSMANRLRPQSAPPSSTLTGYIVLSSRPPQIASTKASKLRATTLSRTTIPLRFSLTLTTFALPSFDQFTPFTYHLLGSNTSFFVYCSRLFRASDDNIKNYLFHYFCSTMLYFCFRSDHNGLYASCCAAGISWVLLICARLLLLADVVIEWAVFQKRTLISVGAMFEVCRSCATADTSRNCSLLSSGIWRGVLETPFQSSGFDKTALSATRPALDARYASLKT